jgi:hypothetical protein
MFDFWQDWIDAGRFTLDAQCVIALRVMRLASGGPQAAAEARHMISEKIGVLAAAQVAAGIALASGSSVAVAGKRAVAPVRRSVQANLRRLSRSQR